MFVHLCRIGRTLRLPVVFHNDMYVGPGGAETVDGIDAVFVRPFLQLCDRIDRGVFKVDHVVGLLQIPQRVLLFALNGQDPLEDAGHTSRRARMCVIGL